jgi:RNA-directed DNA polymerase
MAQCRLGESNALGRVREVARRDKDARFTALLHHVSLGRLRAAYWAIRPQAAPGVYGVTWAEYGQDLEANLQNLHVRVQAGRYRAKPSRRAYIPKSDGRQRPLGIASLEDKIVQRAVVRCLTPSMRWTSGDSLRDSGRDAARMTRWTRSRSGFRGRR